MSLGAGRIVYQSITRIDQAIRAGDFETNAAYLQAIDGAVTADRAVHIMGLLSPGGVHSHEEHLFAAIRLAAQRGATQIYLHAFLDGRDTPPRSAALYRARRTGVRIPWVRAYCLGSWALLGYGPRQSLGAHPANALTVD